MKIEDLFHYGTILTDFSGEVIKGRAIKFIRILTFAFEGNKVFYCKMVDGEVKELRELSYENLG